MATPLISNKGRLLLVEDDGLLRDAISNLLRGEGYVVDEAAKGSEALNLLGRQTYNTVILTWYCRNRPFRELPCWSG